MNTKDLLIEIGMEELPPLSLNHLAESFSKSISSQLSSALLNYDGVQTLFSPRRIAVIVNKLDSVQPDSVQEKTGPALTHAFDSDGNPTKAAEGFARSCGVAVSQLSTSDTEPPKLLFKQQIKGNETAILINGIVQKALEQLPIDRRMRWGNNEFEFVRPVHWVVAMLDIDIIPCNVYGINASNQSFGHRFHHPQAIAIESPSCYCEQLSTAFVVADQHQRKQLIQEQVDKIANDKAAIALYDEALLDEINALVEWPVALLGNFDKRFLEIPEQALISSMQKHQKYFPLTDKNHNLLACFITVANIESGNPAVVIDGNERVIKPRLSDAEFFYRNDLSRTLNTYAEQLGSFTFERQLGSMADKVKRVSHLCAAIAKHIGKSELTPYLTRATTLCKADLLSDMVQEFADLQGEMGECYALHQGEAKPIASAIREHYLPRFSTDILPETDCGLILSIADRIDSLVGIFSIDKAPSGSSDPFALRRHGFAIIRIIIEANLNLNLQDLVNWAIEQYSEQNPDCNRDKACQALDYLMDRMRTYSEEQAISIDVYKAVKALNVYHPIDFMARSTALMQFKTLDAAKDLTQSHKRVNNILKKSSDQFNGNTNVDSSVMQQTQEKQLLTSINTLSVDSAIAKQDYVSALTQIASLKNHVNDFFDNVMVMSEDPEIRINRLALLTQLGATLSCVADIGLLD